MPLDYVITLKPSDFQGLVNGAFEFRVCRILCGFGNVLNRGLESADLVFKLLYRLDLTLSKRPLSQLPPLSTGLVDPLKSALCNKGHFATYDFSPRRTDNSDSASMASSGSILCYCCFILGEARLMHQRTEDSFEDSKEGYTAAY